ncbi:MAG: sulfatase-like hydrolase/transferase, partial [Actinobacteria bacterium]|nr:sulfatase-like hydrolase/transferase [Actinomycetota bacterium]
MFGLAVIAAGCSSIPATSAKRKSGRRPNIVYILTDDLDTEMPGGNWLDHFPRLRALLAGSGTTFPNSFVSNSLCCPSRASILRGQYSHNTEIFTNEGAGGGFQKAHDLGLENSTFATWLHDGGYRTVLLGKYLNGYPGHLDGRYVPPGWDEWYGGANNQYLQSFYQLNENGTIVEYGRSPDDYLQDVLRRKATDFIRRSTTATPRQPFFMWMSTISPHITGNIRNAAAAAAPRHIDAFPGARAPR